MTLSTPQCKYNVAGTRTSRVLGPIDVGLAVGACTEHGYNYYH